MQDNYVCCQLAVTKVTVFYSALVDLTRSRSVHAVEHDPCCPDPHKLPGTECKAVHYGICSPLLKLPSFSTPLVGSLSPSSPATSKDSQSSSLTSTPTQYFKRSPLPASRLDLESIDPVELLASDLGGKLEALVSSFVAQDKVKLAARKKTEIPGNSSNVTKTSTLKNTSPKLQPLGFATYPGRGDRKSKDEHDDISASSDNKNGRYNTLKTSRSSHMSSSQLTHSGNETNSILGKSPQASVYQCKGSSETVSEKVIKKPSTPEWSIARHTITEKIAQAAKVEDKEKLSTSPKASPEYQQTGVKAQINRFTAKENSHLTSLERLEQHKTAFGDKKLNNVCQPSGGFQKVSTVSLEQDHGLTLDKRYLDVSSSQSQTQNHDFKCMEGDAFKIIGSSDSGPSHWTSKEDSFLKLSENDIHAVPKLRQETRAKSQKESRPCSYPSSFQLSDAGALHQRSASQNLSSSRAESLPTVDVDLIANSPPEPFSSKGDSEVRHDRDYVFSPLVYAKNRFHSASQKQKKEETLKPRPRNDQLVIEAKCRWENGVQLSHSQTMWSGMNPYMEQIDLNNENGVNEHVYEALQKYAVRKAYCDRVTESLTPAIPHPKLTMAQKQHIRERSLSPTDRYHSHVPIKPFLTKGSVAERVLLFEKCPDRALERVVATTKGKSNVLYNTWKSTNNEVHNKTQAYRDKENVEPSRTSSLHRISKSGPLSIHIPRFYYPQGHPKSPGEIETLLQKIASTFSGFHDGKVGPEQFGVIAKSSNLPLYWKLPLFLAAGGESKGAVSCDMFLDFWKRVITSCHDESLQFVWVITQGKRKYLLPDDFVPLIQDVIDTHPGLTFLKEAAEFHSRYVHTVIARIYYNVNRSWSGQISIPELRKSNFLQILALLEEEEDINQITEYFSYEHFYVIYCKFWELDKDHDLFIDKHDLSRHNDGAISLRMIERLFSGAVTRGPIQKDGKMSYTEFVWFLLSEEDKRHPRSIEYWFRCMDLDGDGFLSMYELEYFYEEQLTRMEALGIETLPFKDCLCQMLDMIRPKHDDKISLSDLKNCKMTPIFFDTFFNLEKYLDHEQRDPFASQRDHELEGVELSDWDRYAAEEYELLVAEEGANEHPEDLLYEDFEREDDELSPGLEKFNAPGVLHLRTLRDVVKSDMDDDEYDYADSDADYHY